MTIWRKSSRSGSSGSESSCVEVAKFPGNIGLRDSKDPDGPKLILDAADWRALTRQIKASKHDLT